VIEDSLSGIKAAKASGALAVGLTTSFPKELLIQAGADLIIQDFTELDLSKLKRNPQQTDPE
jgi:beta-phosphoglucomutase-like phosphatase (HAD superfamily)